MWYLGYCQGGHTTKAEGNGERMLRQFYVEREIAELGVECWVPREIKFQRRGKKRRAEPIERPYLPNYIFIDLPVERFVEVSGIKYLTGDLMALRRDDVVSLGVFREHVAEEHTKAQRAAANQDAISEYVKGEKLQAINGALGDQLVTFVGMVERAHDVYPKVKVEMEIMGQFATVEMDPLDLRRAE